MRRLIGSTVALAASLAYFGCAGDDGSAEMEGSTGASDSTGRPSVSGGDTSGVDGTSATGIGSGTSGGGSSGEDSASAETSDSGVQGCQPDLVDCFDIAENVDQGGAPGRMIAYEGAVYWQLGPRIVRAHPASEPEELVGAATDFAVAQGAVWVATETSVVRYDLEAAATVDVDSPGSVVSIAADEEGVVVLSDEQGIVELDPEGAEHVTLSDAPIVADARHLRVHGDFVYFVAAPGVGLMRVPRSGGDVEPVWTEGRAFLSVQDVVFLPEEVVVVTASEIRSMPYDLRSHTSLATLSPGRGQFGPLHAGSTSAYLWQYTEIDNQLLWHLVDFDLSSGTMTRLARLPTEPSLPHRTAVVGETIFVSDYQSAIPLARFFDAVYTLPLCGCAF